MLSSLGLRWWQHMIIRGLLEHCIVAEVTSCKKLSLYLGFSYVSEILPFPSKCEEDDFRSKLPLL